MPRGMRGRTDAARRRRVAPPAGPVAGVDEAGRGPVLGPLVVAGVLVADEAPLVALGVRDSKRLTPARREDLEPAIRDAAVAVAVRAVEPAELDRRMAAASLNVVEEELFGDVLRELGAARAVVDACDVDAARFGTRLAARLGGACLVTSEHKADDRHPCVAAASVVAKVARDHAVAALAAEYGDIGSGYAHDPRTQAWLRAWVERHQDLPPIARRRWVTSTRLVPKDRTLIEFQEPKA